MVNDMHGNRIFSYIPGAFTGILLQVSRPMPSRERGKKLREEVQSPTEDLMREHGLLHRLLLVYENLIEKSMEKGSVDVLNLNKAAITIKDYIHDHHEREEEDFLFPRFRDAGYLVDLVETLNEQHDKSRPITDRIIDLTRPGTMTDEVLWLEIVDSCKTFTQMYRHHSAREDTILFPALYDICTREDIDDIKGKMEERDERFEKDKGLERLLANISRIEQAAGTADLSRYTPKRSL
ncbi:MAG: hemerythrin domain-containing protein [Caulobacteraceae bacterium]